MSEIDWHSARSDCVASRFHVWAISLKRWGTYPIAGLLLRGPSAVRGDRYEISSTGLALAQGTNAGGGVGTGAPQTGGTAAPGIGNNAAPSGALPDLKSSTQGTDPCSGAAPQAGCDPTGPGTGTASEAPR